LPKATRPRIAEIIIAKMTLLASSAGKPTSWISGTRCIRGTDMQVQQRTTAALIRTINDVVGNRGVLGVETGNRRRCRCAPAPGASEKRAAS